MTEASAICKKEMCSVTSEVSKYVMSGISLVRKLNREGKFNEKECH
jgi:hypothetical protein